MLNKSYLNKICSLLGIFCILFCLLIILKTQSASNYEFSIYEAYPFVFWLSLLGAFLIGMGILLFCALLPYNKNKSQCFFVITIILLVDSILLYMPLIRGYLNYGSGDVLTHIGWMKDIVRTGYIGNSIMYPIDHILGVTLNYFTGLSLQQITMVVPPLFSFFFIVALYLLSTIIFPTHLERFILLAIGSILLFGFYQIAFVPNAQAFMLLPFLFYLLFKSSIYKENKNFIILLLIICSLIVFFHPLITVIVIFILLILKILTQFQKKINSFGEININLNKLIILLIILFFSWSSYLYVLANTAKPIIDTIIGSKESISEYQNYLNILGQVQTDIPYLIRIVMSIYGQSIIIGILSLLCCIYLLLKIIRKEKILYIYLISSLCFLTFSILSLLLFFINSSFQFGRIYAIALMFSIILIPSFSRLSNLANNKPILFYTLLLLVLAVIIGFSIFNLYTSPIIKMPNQQVTNSEYLGMVAFYQTRDISYPILEHGLSQYRMYDVIYGTEYPKINVRFSTPSQLLIPLDHFGYNERISFGSIFKEPQYFILTNQGKNYYPKIYPEFQQKWRFTMGDFKRLNNDVTVKHIYNNGNLEIMIIG